MSNIENLRAEAREDYNELMRIIANGGDFNDVRKQAFENYKRHMDVIDRLEKAEEKERMKLARGIQIPSFMF